MKRVEDTCGLMAIDSATGATKGALIFDNFLNKSCQVTIILESSLVLKHGFLEAGFQRIFCDMCLTHMYCLIADNNVKSLRLNERLGFIEKFRIPNGYAEGVDFVVTELDRENSAIYKKMTGVNNGLS